MTSLRTSWEHYLYTSAEPSNRNFSYISYPNSRKLLIKCMVDEKILYSSFRSLYLCTFASDKSCLAEEHRISQNLRPLPSHYLVLREKLINSLFLIYSYLHIEFLIKNELISERKSVILFSVITAIIVCKSLYFTL